MSAFEKEPIKAYKNQNSKKYEPVLPIDRGKVRYVFDDGSSIDHDMRITAKTRHYKPINIVELPSVHRITKGEKTKRNVVKLMIGANNKNNNNITPIDINYFSDLRELYIDKGYKKIGVSIRGLPSLEYIWLPENGGMNGQEFMFTGPLGVSVQNPVKVKFPLNIRDVVLTRSTEVENMEELLEHGDDGLNMRFL